jgi:hypothetical protein
MESVSTPPASGPAKRGADWFLLPLVARSPISYHSTLSPGIDRKFSPTRIGANGSTNTIARLSKCVEILLVQFLFEPLQL